MLKRNSRSAGPLAKASQHIDFNQLVAKLNDINHEKMEASQGPASPPPQPERPPTPLSDPGIAREHQIRCYHELLSDGGRSPYPLEALDKIYESPADYVEILRPWLVTSQSPLNPDWWGVFSRPLERWREFRKRQLDNRGADTTDEDSLATYRDKMRRNFESTGDLDSLLAISDYDDTIERMWLHEQPRRELEKDRARGVYGGSFAIFNEVACHRLRGHGFDEEFQFLEDLRQQDDRVTWIEYLEFEYRELDRRTKAVQRYQKQHDAARKELVRSGILRDGGTDEEESLRLEGPYHNEVETSAIAQYKRQKRKYQEVKADEDRQRAVIQWALGEVPAEHQKASFSSKLARKRMRQGDDEGVEVSVE